MFEQELPGGTCDEKSIDGPSLERRCGTCIFAADVISRNLGTSTAGENWLSFAPSGPAVAGREEARNWFF